MTTATALDIKVADEVWIATALLHREHPDQADFSVAEIMNRVRQEGLTETLRAGVQPHIYLHCVANLPPNPSRKRMLFETSKGRRRLFRKGDTYHPDRERGDIVPDFQRLPAEYAPLLDWYSEWSSDQIRKSLREDPLLGLRGSGKQIWADEHADEYIRRLREGWL